MVGSQLKGGLGGASGRTDRGQNTSGNRLLQWTRWAGYSEKRKSSRGRASYFRPRASRSRVAPPSRHYEFLPPASIPLLLQALGFSALRSYHGRESSSEFYQSLPARSARSLFRSAGFCNYHDHRASCIWSSIPVFTRRGWRPVRGRGTTRYLRFGSTRSRCRTGSSAWRNDCGWPSFSTSLCAPTSVNSRNPNWWHCALLRCRAAWAGGKSLVGKALRKDIKKAVTQWRPDYWRV